MKKIYILILPVIICSICFYACKKDGVIKEFILVQNNTSPGINTGVDTIRLLISCGYPILEDNMKNPVISQPPNGVISNFSYFYTNSKHQEVNIKFLIDAKIKSDIYYRWTFSNGAVTQIKISSTGTSNANYFSALKITSNGYLTSVFKRVNNLSIIQIHN